MPLGIVCLILPFKEEVRKGEQCNTPILKWIFVMGLIHLCHILRSLVTLIFIVKLHKAKKIKRTLNLVFIATVTLFEVIWLIYGNTFHYSSESMLCKDRQNIKPVWILMMIELTIGYIIYLSCGLLVGGLSLYFWIRSNY